MIILILIAGILAGMAIPVQTSINSRLGMKIGSPYGAAAISFCRYAYPGHCRLSDRAPFCLSSDFSLPSPCGSSLEADVQAFFYLTSNILLLPRLGSALTVVVTLLGQMVMALAIDHFGWFHIPVHELNFPRIIGIFVHHLRGFHYQKY